MLDFQSFDHEPLADGELELVLAGTFPADPERGQVPELMYVMMHAKTGKPMGELRLRLGNTDWLIHYGGHIGYRVEPEYRGHRYAARSCKLVLPIAKRQGINPLWITCDPENIASRRTCEILGAELVEIIPLKEDHPLYASGARERCRYRLDL